ncbi:MAG TPA: DJ-1/PfpI family protein [Candidatus Baltobacteraceae bacterium]
MVRIGMLLFPRLTLLDLIGPHQVFAGFHEAQISLIAASLEPVQSDSGVTILPTDTFDDSGELDVLFVPGGFGVNEAMEDDHLTTFLAERAQTAQWITSVCTGALVLGAAGLLRGYRATTHWRYLELLEPFGALPVDERVVIDRNRVTGGGVTAGIDFGLTLGQELFGAAAARRVQLYLQYDPQPPAPGGTPRTSDPQTVAAVREESAANFARRKAIVEGLTSSGAPTA